MPWRSRRCLWGAAEAQVAPVRYFLPSGLFGLGGTATTGNASETYRNFPSFDAGDAADWRAAIPTGLFVGSQAGSVGLSGFGPSAAFSQFGELSYQSTQFGYAFKGVGGMPVTVFAGFDTLNYNPGLGNPMASFSGNAGTAAGYRVNAGVEFQPAPNVSLSLGGSFAQPQSERLDSDIRSPLLPGESPIFLGGRR